MYLTHSVIARHTVMARWWTNTKGSRCLFAPKVSYHVLPCVRHGTGPSISLPAFCYLHIHQYHHVNIRHSDFEYLVFSQNAAATVRTGVVFSGIYAVLYSNRLRRSDIKRGFHVDSRHVHLHNSVITAAVVRVPRFTVPYSSFQWPPPPSLVLYPQKKILSRQIPSANPI